MKTVRRTIIIRETEYLAKCAYIAGTHLYDRADYEPLTYKGIQLENFMRVLSDTTGRVRYRAEETLPNLYAAMLSREPNLYNKQYLKWKLTMDYPDGQIYVQSRSDAPRDKLVLATFEKDYE